MHNLDVIWFTVFFCLIGSPILLNIRILLRLVLTKSDSSDYTYVFELCLLIGYKISRTDPMINRVSC